MRLLRIPAGATSRLVRGYAASAPKPDPEHDVEPQAESSTAAQRRLWPAPPVNKSKDKELYKQNRVTLTSDREAAVKRRRAPNALALMKAQKFAQAIIKESEPPSGSSVTVPSPPPSPSDTLRAISQQPSQAAPTLEDLEAKRPPKGPIPISSKRYPGRYKRLYDTIDNAFVSKQLLKLAREMGVRVPKGRGKGLAIKGILQVWGWEPPMSKEELDAREQAQDVVMRDTVERDWELKQGELWLIMRDSENLRPIMEQGVRFSIPSPVSASASGNVEGKRAADGRKEGWRVLRGTGNDASLAEMDNFINERRAAIEQCTREIDYVDQSNSESILLGAISNAANVFIERKWEGKVRILGLNTESVSKAESLLAQAIYHDTTRASTLRSIILPSSSEEFAMALYPHLPSPISSIPWQELGSASRPLFRLRGIQPWEFKVGQRETAHVEQNMEDLPFISLASEDQDRGVKTAIEGLGLGGWKSESERSGIVARFGHTLYAKSGSERDLLSPPITKRSTPTSVAADLDTVTADHPSIFIPCLPPSLIHFPLDSKISRSRQLTYRANDGRLLEVVYHVPMSPEIKAEEVEGPVSQERGWHQELDDMFDKLEVDPVEEQESIPSQPIIPPTPPQVRILPQEAKEVAMPDRPVDLNLTRRSFEREISDDDIASIPQIALDYLHSPSSSNPPPSTLELLGESWKLASALELDISEVKVEPPSDLGLGLQESNSGVKIRTVKSTDLTFGSGRSVQYAELESEGELSSTFWTELARLSRVVSPGAGVLRTEIY